MRRRLDLATALVHDPSVLFLDEPTTGLDPVSRIAIWEEVQRLNDEGTTVFLTTQYLEEADQLADRVGIIDDGKMAAEGTPAELKAQVGIAHLEVVIAAGESARRRGDPRPLRRADAGPRRHPHGRPARAAPPTWRRSCARWTRPGCAVEALELVQPTLDDVFVEKTGRHLEGAADEQPQPSTSRSPA